MISIILITFVFILSYFLNGTVRYAMGLLISGAAVLYSLRA